MIEPGVGFIKVSKFAATTYSEFLTAIANLRGQRAKKYIIDLRENSGGFMDQAINMVNEFYLPIKWLFIPKEKFIPVMRPNRMEKGSCIGLPVVVMIDEFSASASEILQVLFRTTTVDGIIVGRRSFGKGLVQQQIDLSDGSALRLTVARYFYAFGTQHSKALCKRQCWRIRKGHSGTAICMANSIARTAYMWPIA